jgi:hypothetical protein
MEKEPGAGGYSWATLSLGDINTGTSLFRLGVGRKADGLVALDPVPEPLVQDINLQNEDCFVSFVFVSLFTYVLAGEVLQVKVKVTL